MEGGCVLVDRVEGVEEALTEVGVEAEDKVQVGTGTDVAEVEPVAVPLAGGRSALAVAAAAKACSCGAAESDEAPGVTIGFEVAAAFAPGGSSAGSGTCLAGRDSEMSFDGSWFCGAARVPALDSPARACASTEGCSCTWCCGGAACVPTLVFGCGCGGC